MKIAILSSLYPPFSIGGAEKAANMLAEALKAQGVDVIVISFYPGKTELIEDLNGVRVYRLPIDNIRPTWLGGKRPGPFGRLVWHIIDTWNLKAARRVRSILERERPDVLHTHGVSGFSVAIWAAAKRLKIARVHTLHDYYLLCPRTTLFRNGKVCEARCVGCRSLTWPRMRASNLVQVVTGVSKAVLDRNVGEGCFPEAKRSVVYNIQRSLVPGALPDKEVLTFGFIGRITPEKGIELLLDAMIALPDTICRLKIAGTGDKGYVEGLKAHYRDERIEWLGFVTSNEFFGMVDVVVLPSVWPEPLPYSCVESLFAGKSIIASDLGGLSELASLSPVHRLIKAGDCNALIQAMREALDNRLHWKEDAVPSPKTLSLFSEEAITRQYLRLYDAVLEE